MSGAGSAEFAVDPLLGHSLSAVTSFLTSVVKRSGAVIEDALYAALVRNRRFLVMQQVRIPITRAAEMYVQENGPGGVTVSYFEWVQNRQGFYWPLEEIHDRLRAIMEREGRAIWGVSKDKDVSMRTAAYVHALSRLAEAIEAHGTQSFFVT